MAVDMFLKIDGIPGESNAAGHSNEIVIESFSWGEAQAAAGSTSKVAMNDVSFVAKVSKASPLLMQACATGLPIANADLALLKAGAAAVLFEKWKFTNVIVSAYKFSYGGNIPLDSFSLTFERISFEYTPQNVMGGPDLPNQQTVTWNRRTNTV